jgi:hypothetical protein
MPEAANTWRTHRTGVSLFDNTTWQPRATSSRATPAQRRVIVG